MRGAHLQSCCRAAVWFPRKRPRLGFSDHTTGRFSSNLKYASRSFAISFPRALPIRSRHQSEVEAAEARQKRDIESQQAFEAAAPIDFEAKDNQETQDEGVSEKKKREQYWKKLRFLPASPAYFSGVPQFTDDLLLTRKLLRKYSSLPTAPSSQVPRVTWRKFASYVPTLTENVKPSMFNRIIAIMKRLNRIHPQLRTRELQEAIDSWSTSISRSSSDTTLKEPDEWGRMKGIGRRKASSATAWVVEGEGEVLINGRPLHQAFARVHDRESVIWALKSTERVDKYNVFGLVSGGGSTGQAEALTLAISNALMAHEPSLKPLLRKAGCITRDPRQVERKKPGRYKARKGFRWVKR